MDLRLPPDGRQSLQQNFIPPHDEAVKLEETLRRRSRDSCGIDFFLGPVGEDGQPSAPAAQPMLGIISETCYNARHQQPSRTTPMPHPEPAASSSPCPRSPARIAASRNALKHGLAALHHLVLEDEAPSELEELVQRLLDELGAASELEARLVRRIALAFWKGERAERMEVALFDAAPRKRPPTVGGTWVEADPLATFDLQRFHAIHAYQAQQGRELSRCLKELRQLRREPLIPEVDAGRAAETEPQNEPEPSAAARMPNEPDALAAAPLAQPLAPPPPPSAAENEPETLAGADLPFLQPRHPVPLPGRLATELDRPMPGVSAGRQDDRLPRAQAAATRSLAVRSSVISALT
jgi:hypothetical protein